MDFDSVDVFGVEDVNDIGGGSLFDSIAPLSVPFLDSEVLPGGEPLYSCFQYEDCELFGQRACFERVDLRGLTRPRVQNISIQ